MSALLQSPNLFRSLRRVTEQEAITSIGRHALTATDAASGIESLAGVALRLSGLHGVEITLELEEGYSETMEWHDSKSPAPRGSATGMIAANSRAWGRLSIFFEPHMKSVECPLRFARVLAQHLALMLNRLEVAGRHATVAAAVNRLQHRLDTRKAVSRAAGILASARNLTHRQALAVLLEQARESRRPLLPLARTVILGQEAGHLQHLRLRRLEGDQATNAAHA
jgi:hypothetical protein